MFYERWNDEHPRRNVCTTIAVLMLEISDLFFGVCGHNYWDLHSAWNSAGVIPETTCPSPLNFSKQTNKNLLNHCQTHPISKA